jgi:hypothetical protein
MEDDFISGKRQNMFCFVLFFRELAWHCSAPACLLTKTTPSSQKVQDLRVSIGLSSVGPQYSQGLNIGKLENFAKPCHSLEYLLTNPLPKILMN